MPLALQLGFASVDLVCMTSGIVALVRTDLRGPEHRVTSKTAVWILVYLGGLLWLSSFLKGTPALQAIGLIVVFAAAIAMIYPLRIIFRDLRIRRMDGR